MNKYVPLAQVCEIVKGTTGIKKAIAGDFPLVATSEERLSHNEYQFDCDAVCIPLVSSTGHGHASIKRIHYQSGKFALGTILCAVIPKNSSQLNAKYLYIYLHINKDTVLVPLMKGAANVSLNTSKLAGISIPLPSIKRQTLIVEKFEQFTRIITDLNEMVEQSKILAAMLNRTLLNEVLEIDEED